MTAPKPYSHVPLTGAPSLRAAMQDYAELPSPLTRERLRRAYDLLSRQDQAEIDECKRRMQARTADPTCVGHARWTAGRHLDAIADIDDALAAARRALAADMSDINTLVPLPEGWSWVLAECGECYAYSANLDVHVSYSDPARSYVPPEIFDALKTAHDLVRKKEGT